MKFSEAWFLNPCASVNDEAISQAKNRQAQLTKPLGSLGRLEQLAIQFAGWQNSMCPTLEQVAVRVFAADHGVCQQSVSAFPQEVTVQMIANFCAGGAAINVLCDEANAHLSVINMGVAHPLIDEKGVINAQLMQGTHDLSERAAMSRETMLEALRTGAEQVPVVESATTTVQLCIGGEMGIGNTTSASAIYAALLPLEACETVGSGTGVDESGVARKVTIVSQALELHCESLHDPLGVLQCLGGLEIAGLTGFYIRAAQRGIPILIDGFICTAAALLAVRINPACRDWMLFSHCSAEHAHGLALKSLQAEPILDLGLRLGEGSGAVLCVSLLRSALALHNRMATFSEAGVANG